MENWIGIIIDIFTLVFGIFVYVSFRRYAKEKFWLKKADTYEQVLSETYKLYVYYVYASIDNVALAKELHKSLEEANKISDHLKEISIIGRLYFCEDFYKELNKFIMIHTKYTFKRSLSKEDMFTEADQTIKNMISIAKKDLFIEK